MTDINELKEEELLKIIEAGFHFEYNNQIHIDFLNKILKSNNLYEILDKINNLQDIIFIIINTSIPKLVLLKPLIDNNLNKIIEIIKSPYIKEEHINFIIESINLENLNEKVLEIAIEKGYKPNEYVLELIEKNKHLLIKKIENITDINELLNLINNLSEESLKDNLIINLAITKGYYFTKDTPNVLKNNKQVLKRILASIYFKHENNNFTIETINNCNPDILDETILNTAREKLGYKITISSPIQKINEIYDKYFDEYIKSFKGKTREKYIKLSQKIGKGILYFEKDNSLLKKEVVDTFGDVAISKIYKYYNLLGNNIDFDHLINSNNLEKFKYLFTVISENNDNFKTFDIVLFLNFLDKYEEYGNLAFEFIAKYGINDNTKKILITLLTHKYKNLKIENIEDLKNIDLIIKEKNKEVIESNNILEIKNIICLMLCNRTLDEINQMFYSINKIELLKLKEEIKEIKAKEILSKYIILIKFLEYIKNCNDLTKIKLIAQKMNNYDSEKLEKLKNNFINIFENIKYFYALEINEKLTKLDSLKNTDKIVISSYKDESGKEIKYIEIYEECIFFQHTMNAFGNGKTILEYKNPKLVNQTRFCLSLISNNVSGVEKESTDINNVTLLFDTIEPNGLITMDNSDISSKTGKNSFALSHTVYTQFFTVKDMLENTKRKKYNEYDVYLENSDGTFIYPCAVKVVGNEPNEAEIEAASILNVPLVKLHKIKEIEKRISSFSTSNQDSIEHFSDFILEIEQNSKLKK